MGALRGSLVGVILLALPAAAVELKNDSFTPGSQVSFQSGFVSGESGAVKLTAPFSSGRVTAVRLLFGGAATLQTATITIWDDAPGTDPGAVLYSGDWQFSGSDLMQEIDLSAESVQVSSTFRVGLTFQHTGRPSLATDSDGVSGGNYVHAQFPQGLAWSGAATVGLTGDFVIRAEVVDTTDAGADAGDDAGVLDAGVDAGVLDAGVDAGVLDAGVDAGVLDAGVDAGADDAGSPDAGGLDGGTDAGMVDAGAMMTVGCLSNTECALGQYCDPAVQRCTFDCIEASDCGGGMVCSKLGKCVGDGKPQGCGCTSIPGAMVAAVALLAVLRRRRR